jgi:hypothetical protein
MGQPCEVRSALQASPVRCRTVWPSAGGSSIQSRPVHESSGALAPLSGSPAAASVTVPSRPAWRRRTTPCRATTPPGLRRAPRRPSLSPLPSERRRPSSQSMAGRQGALPVGTRAPAGGTRACRHRGRTRLRDSGSVLPPVRALRPPVRPGAARAAASDRYPEDGRRRGQGSGGTAGRCGRGCAKPAVTDRVATVPAGTENLAPCAGTRSTPGRSAAGWSGPP